MNNPRLSFGLIVLNGEPFTKYCLRQIYPYAYEIIVVEGGSTKAAEVAPQGHSIDGTLEALREFKKKEDPDDKLKIITRDGFWSEKDEQSQAYAKVATGDYLWQIDIDEFYTQATLEKILRLLRQQPEISGMSFQQITFWGAPEFYCDNYFLRSFEYHRLFKWGRGFQYLTHRPPTVCDDTGCDLRRMNWWGSKKTFSQGFVLYHYSLLFPDQVIRKCIYYSTPSKITDKGYTGGIQKWMQNCYFQLGNPFRVHNIHRHISWLNRFRGTHPEQMAKLWADIKTGKVRIPIREKADIERLLSNPFYKRAVTVLSLWTNIIETTPLLQRLWLVWNRLICKILRT